MVAWAPLPPSRSGVTPPGRMRAPTICKCATTWPETGPQRGQILAPVGPTQNRHIAESPQNPSLCGRCSAESPQQRALIVPAAPHCLVVWLLGFRVACVVHSMRGGREENAPHPHHQVDQVDSLLSGNATVDAFLLRRPEHRGGGTISIRFFQPHATLPT